MKIALISDWYPPRIGGLELQMRDLAVELTRSGHHVQVICLVPGPAVQDGVRVHRVDESILPVLKTVWKPSTVAAVERIFLDEQFDLVHCHTAFSPLSLVGAFLANRLNIPSVLTEHSVLKGFGGRLLGAVDRVYPWSGWPDVLTAVSNYVADELKRVSGREVRLLPNGVRLDEWDLPNDDSAGPVVATVMRLRSRKRPLDLVRAIARVHEKLPPSARPRFVLAGDGPERIKVERLAKRLGVAQHLELPGWQARPEVKKILARATVFALPTSKEALSIATLEALAAGVPSVAMDHGGVGDIIRNGREGFLARDFDDFVACIARICGDRELRQRLQSEARASAERFSWQNVLAQHEEVYRLARERRLGAQVTKRSVAA